MTHDLLTPDRYFIEGKVTSDTPLALVSPGGGTAQLKTIPFGFDEPGIDLLTAIYGRLCSQRAQNVPPDRNPVRFDRPPDERPVPLSHYKQFLRGMRTPGNYRLLTANHPGACPNPSFLNNPNEGFQGRVACEGMSVKQIEQILVVSLARPGTGTCPGIVEEVIAPGDIVVLRRVVKYPRSAIRKAG